MSRPPRWIEGERVWVITRYRDAVALLKSDDVAIVEQQIGNGHVGHLLGPNDILEANFERITSDGARDFIDGSFNREARARTSDPTIRTDRRLVCFIPVGITRVQVRSSPVSERVMPMQFRRPSRAVRRDA